MSITRRQAIAVLAGALPALRGIYTLAREAPSLCDSKGPVSRMKPICRNLCMRNSREAHQRILRRYDRNRRELLTLSRITRTAPTCLRGGTRPGALLVTKSRMRSARSRARTRSEGDRSDLPKCPRSHTAGV